MNYPQGPQQGPQGETERRPAGQAVSGRASHASDGRYDQRGGVRTASVHTLHAFGRTGNQPEPPSLVRRILRSVIWFVVTLAIGIGGTLGWLSYGDAVKGMVAVQAPTLARLLPPTGWPAPSNPTQPPAYNLETLRLNIEQLAARQDLMAQSFATLLAVEMDIRQKMAFTPATAGPAPVAPAAAAPSPAQPRARTVVAQ